MLNISNSSYRVGPGSLMWLLGVALIAIPIGTFLAVSTFESDGSIVLFNLVFFGSPAVLGLWVLWSASRHAVVSDTTVTFRSFFRSTSIPWTDVVLVRHSEAWLVIRDRYGDSHRIGPYPHMAYDFERDIRERRARGLSHASVWSSRHPFNRELEDDPTIPFDQEPSPPLTMAQGFGAVLMVILLLVFRIGLQDLGSASVRYLRNFGMTQETAILVVGYAVLQLLFLAGFLKAWVSAKEPLWGEGKVWIFWSIFLAALIGLWSLLDAGWRHTGLSDGWEALAMVAGTVVISGAMARIRKAFAITMPIRNRA